LVLFNLFAGRLLWVRAQKHFENEDALLRASSSSEHEFCSFDTYCMSLGIYSLSAGDLLPLSAGLIDLSRLRGLSSLRGERDLLIY